MGLNLLAKIEAEQEAIAVKRGRAAASPTARRTSRPSRRPVGKRPDQFYKSGDETARLGPPHHRARPWPPCPTTSRPCRSGRWR